MNSTLIGKMLKQAVYLAHTGQSYHRAEIHNCYTIANKVERDRAVRDAIRHNVEAGNEALLPYRLQILKGDTMTPTARVGRASKPIVAQLKADFISIEESPYKIHKPYKVHTGLWRVEGYQTYYYGTIGITGGNGRIDQDNADLVIIHTQDWQRLEVYIFRGLAGTHKQLDYLPDVMGYLTQRNGVK